MDISHLVGKRIKFARLLMEAKQYGFLGFDDRKIRRYEEGQIPQGRFQDIAEGLEISTEELLNRDDDLFIDALLAAIEKKRGKLLSGDRVEELKNEVLAYGERQKKALLKHVKDCFGKFEIIVPYEGSMEEHFRIPALFLQVPGNEMPPRNRSRALDFVNPRRMSIWRYEDARQERSGSYCGISLKDLLGDYTTTLSRAGLTGGGSKDVPRFVLLSHPGGGKTTLARYLAWSCASDNKKLFNLDLVPAFIRLPEWKASSIRDPSAFLATFYSEETTGIGADWPCVKHWDWWLRRGDVLLLLDGLDEIENSSEFVRVLEAVLNRFKSCPTMITCRSLSNVRYKALYHGFPLVTLGCMERDEQEEYIRAFPSRRKERFGALALVQQLKSSPPMHPLTSNPLMLSIICYVVDNTKPGIKVPATRGEIYDGAIDALLRATDEGIMKSDRSRWVEAWYPYVVLTAQKRKALETAALALLVSVEEGRLLFDELTLLDALEKGAAHAGALSRNGNVISSLVEDFTKNSGILRKDSLGRYFFLHPTIQEYLAGCSLARMVNSKGWNANIELHDRLVTVLNLIDCKCWDSEWQEVIAFLAGQIDDAIELLERLTDENEDDLFRHRLALAATCLPEMKAIPPTSYSHIIKRITMAAWNFWLQVREWCDDTTKEYIHGMLAPLSRLGGMIDGLPLEEHIRMDWSARHPICESQEDMRREITGAVVAGRSADRFSHWRPGAPVGIRTMERGTAMLYRITDHLDEMSHGDDGTAQWQEKNSIETQAVGSGAPKSFGHIGALAGMLHGGGGTKQRRAAAGLIQTLGSAAAEHPGVLDGLAGMLASEERDDRFAALEALQAIGIRAAHHDGILHGMAGMLAHEGDVFSCYQHFRCDIFGSLGIRVFRIKPGEYQLRRVYELTRC